MAHSPLARASETASIIWAGNEGASGSGRGSDETPKPPPVVPLPSLREIDLHSFQGLLKSEGFSGRRAAAYARWKSCPEGFEVDGRAPVRDLWERAREAWGELLEELLLSAAPPASSSSPSSSGPSASSADAPRFLVVAHNAVNQALVSAAVGLPPRAFRRIVQSNGCVTELELELPTTSPLAGSPVGSSRLAAAATAAAASAKVLRLNVGPRPPLKRPEKGGGVALVVLVSLDEGAAAGRGGGEGVLATSRLGAARERVIRLSALLFVAMLSFPPAFPPSEEAVGPWSAAPPPPKAKLEAPATLECCCCCCCCCCCSSSNRCCRAVVAAAEEEAWSCCCCRREE